MATAKELRELTVEDLKNRAAELREQLFRDRMKLRTGTLESPTQRRERRRDLARVLTIIRQKQP
ncbi:MAG TPA: 50S ribosomal protein L29 [Myxococcaceae bacterium]|jgi:large subunit ribosomal protein L29|nr:50S ribosomal protein L29 [Myxococcaceae bacterium]